MKKPTLGWCYMLGTASSIQLLCHQGTLMFLCFWLPTSHVWAYNVNISGTTKKRQYIPIDAVFNNLPRDSATPLLPFHTLTVCDTTSYIANHTKRSSWKVFKEHHQLIMNLGIGELTDETIRSSETFVCRIYDVHKTYYVDAARHILFSKTGKPETYLLT